MMLHIVSADNVGTQLLHGIISWQFLQFVVGFLSIFGFIMTSAVIIILAERKIMGWMQDRVGPMHTGPWGLLQTVADVGKLLLKEDIHAANTDKLIFLLAPSVFMAPVIGAFAVLPFSPYIGLPGSALATGLVFLVAMSSLERDRCDYGGLGLEQQILVDRWSAFRCSDDLIRTSAGASAGWCGDAHQCAGWSTGLSGSGWHWDHFAD